MVVPLFRVWSSGVAALVLRLGTKITVDKWGLSVPTDAEKGFSMGPSPHPPAFGFFSIRNLAPGAVVTNF